jgi:ABC-type multidrug transport system fused ATPase/permease subunit
MGRTPVTQDSLRSHIGMVTQDIAAAPSVRDNITAQRTDADVHLRLNGPRPQASSAS